MTQPAVRSEPLTSLPLDPSLIQLGALSQKIEADKSSGELNAIHRMVDAVSRADALEDIYAAALDELIRTVSADRAAVLLFDSNGVMRFKASRGLSDEYMRAVEGHTPWSPDDSNAQPIVVTDVAGDATLTSYMPVFAKEGISALGFIPLTDAGKLLGKFMIYFNRPHVVQDAELRLAQTIASHIGFAIMRKKTETEMRELYREAQEANFAKSQFLTRMSHELRTPLNAIGGYAELLEMQLHGPLTEEQRQDVSRIQRSQRHLLGLINDLLSFARIETGHIELRDEVVLIEDALVGVEVLVAPQIRNKSLNYRRERSAVGLVCRGDIDKISQVLLNLVSNAVKFTPANHEISVDWENGESTVSIHITDTGPGIPAEKLEAIFEPFVQVTTSPAQVAEGTGLGLAISRELARAMGGDVTVTSVQGAGSTFTLTLPRA